MIRFDSDYLEGACPQVLDALVRTNLVQTAGYGEDDYCARAKALIRRKVNRPDAHVRFVAGGTQANLIVITAALRPHEGAVAADTGHIAVHESGAIEASGHKVLTLPHENGKLTAARVDALAAAHTADPTHEHMVRPGLVYLSHPTELGTLYTLAELEAISAVCRRWRMKLYVDGARLAYGLSAPDADITLPDLARLCDAFSIGGTKAGALFGEALVLTNPDLAADFTYIVKQRGGLFAKGRLLGVQYEALMTDGVYEAIGARADALAYRIRDAFRAKGCDFLIESPTNQQFPILTGAQAAALRQAFSFSPWATLPDGREAVRFCASFATRDADVDALCAAIAEM